MEIVDVSAVEQSPPRDEIRKVKTAHTGLGGIRRPRNREHLTAPEVQTLTEAARKGRYGLRDSTLLLMLFSHGLRLTEALRLTFRDVDLDRGILHIKRRKSGVSGDHKLRGIEIRALRRLQRENRHPAGDLIFTSERGGPLSSRNVQLMIDRVSDRAGLKHLNIHPHSLRHACGYYMAERNYNLPVIQTYLGHREVRHTKRYVEISTRQFDGLFDD
jgi:integrase